MKVITVLISLGSLAVLLSACAQSAEAPQETERPGVEKTVYVGSQMVDCVGVAPQKCLLVKESMEDEYRMFYDTIAGFEFEPGYEYELIVREEQVENPPADASSINWTLVKIVNRTPVTASLEGVLWGLVSYLGAEGGLVDVLPDSTASAEFNDGRVSGNASCNNYFGSAQINGDQLTIGQLGSTQMYCPEPAGLMDQENSYLGNLQIAASFTIIGGRLEVRNDQGATVLVFQELQSQPLAGTNWVLLSYNNGKGGVVSVLAGTEITAVFTEDGKLSGSAGCNNYMTSYSVDGNTIKIDLPATTRKMCSEPQGIMEQEAAFTLALEQAATYELKQDALTIRGAEGETQLQFVAAQ